MYLLHTTKIKYIKKGKSRFILFLSGITLSIKTEVEEFIHKYRQCIFIFIGRQFSSARCATIQITLLTSSSSSSLKITSLLLSGFGKWSQWTTGAKLWLIVQNTFWFASLVSVVCLYIHAWTKYPSKLSLTSVLLIIVFAYIHFLWMVVILYRP